MARRKLKVKKLVCAKKVNFSRNMSVLLELNVILK